MVIERELRLERRPHLVASLGVLRRGGGDPTWRAEGPASFWKGWQTPQGPVAARLNEDVPGRAVRLEAHGPGADWLAEALPGLVGEGDADEGFDPVHEAVARARRRFPGWRVPRTGMVVEALVPAIIEQKVTGVQAFGAYRLLVRRFGEPAPGPGAELGLRVAPTAQGWARIASWEWLQAGVDAQRADTLMRALRSAGRLERLVEREPAAAREALRVIPGVGVWTAAEVAQRAFGDADAVSFGDYHVARNIGWALTGVCVDDGGLAELLQPYAGHRYRVQRLLELVGARRPRRGPRMSVPTHLPVRRG